MNPLWVKQRLIALLIVGLIVWLFAAHHSNEVAGQPGNASTPVAADSQVSPEISAQTPPVGNDH